MTFGDNRISIALGDTIVSSNLVEGSFPPYEDVIPKDCDKSVEAKSDDLVRALKRAALLITEESKGVRIHCDSTGLRITGRSPEASEATIQFPCRYQGKDMEIGFNPAFLAEGLQAVAGEDVRIEMSAPNRPGMVVAGTYRYVVMPVGPA